MRQTKNSSYKNLFSVLADSENFFEVDILDRIQEGYLKYHKTNLQDFIQLHTNDLRCPKCRSYNIIKHGKNKSGSKRYKCKSCGKTFSSLGDSLFFSSKVNIKAWLAFLECILSGCSTLEACIVAKISTVIGVEWMKKVFKTLRDYQNDITLETTVFIDDTHVHEDSSKIYLLEDIGKIKKVKKQPRGISRNKICILVATDETRSIAHIVCHGRPQRKLVYNICKNHLMQKSTIIGDIDTSLTYTAKMMGLSRITYKSNTYEAYEKLEPIDEFCARFKFFIDKHRGFKKVSLQDYINLFIFIDNEKKLEKDLYKITTKLFEMMFNYKKRLIPYFEPKKLLLTEVTNRHIQEYYNYCINEESVSGNTVLRRHTNLHMAFKHAVRTDLILKNPTEYVEKPKKRKYRGKIYDKDELNHLFSLVEGQRIEFAVKVASYYGLRRSEIVGLKWSAFDFKKKAFKMVIQSPSSHWMIKWLSLKRIAVKQKRVFVHYHSFNQ